MSNNEAALQRLGFIRRLVLVSYGLILLTFLARALMTYLAGQNLVVVLFLLLVQVLPLLIFLPGLRSNHLRTHAWLSFAVLMYFIYAVLTAFTSDTLWYGLILCVLVSTLFSALVIYIQQSRKLLGTSLQ